MTSNSIRVEPLTPTIGAEVWGVDLSRTLDARSFEALRQALLSHLVLFFRDQGLDLDQLEALGHRFGELHIHPTETAVEGHPELIRVHVDANSTVYAGRMWHSDVSCEPAPPMGSILHLHETPATGGDTLFANMYAAYEALSDPMKAWLAGLEALHESKYNLRVCFGATEEELRDGHYPEAVHPVVCSHPETGRKVLFVNESFTSRIVGLAPEESRALLAFLFRHIASPRFQCRFRWRENSVAFWDNRCAQHMAMWDYYPHTRSGHRATLAGTRPTRD
jgi:taurine dioxygenase